MILDIQMVTFPQIHPTLKPLGIMKQALQCLCLLPGGKYFVLFSPHRCFFVFFSLQLVFKQQVYYIRNETFVLLNVNIRQFRQFWSQTLQQIFLFFNASVRPFLKISFLGPELQQFLNARLLLFLT